MQHRSGKKMIIDTMSELEDAKDALLIIQHSDGTIGWHSMTDLLSSKLGLLRYVEICIDQNIRESPDVAFAEEKETVQ
jgi:hypothetical protein